MRRYDRITRLRFQPLDPCGRHGSTFNPVSLGAFLHARSLRSLGCQPEHVVEARPETSGRQPPLGIAGPYLRHVLSSGTLPVPGAGVGD